MAMIGSLLGKGTFITIPPELKRYAFVFKDTKIVNVVTYFYPNKPAAEKKSKSLRTTATKIIVKARDERGRFTSGYVLICFK